MHTLLIDTKSVIYCAYKDWLNIYFKTQVLQKPVFFQTLTAKNLSYRYAPSISPLQSRLPYHISNH